MIASEDVKRNEYNGDCHYLPCLQDHIYFIWQHWTPLKEVLGNFLSGQIPGNMALGIIHPWLGGGYLKSFLIQKAYCIFYITKNIRLEQAYILKIN